jgi:hypothetical protein
LYEPSKYKKPLKDFLSDFMASRRDLSKRALGKYRTVFADTCSAVRARLGSKPFHIRAGLNAAVFDSVFTAFGRKLESVPDDVRDRYQRLIKNSDYLSVVSRSTTDEEVVARRLKLAREALFS